jgi:hypothetical protein
MPAALWHALSLGNSEIFLHIFFCAPLLCRVEPNDVKNAGAQFGGAAA